MATEAEHKVPCGSVGEPKAALQHLDDALQRQRGLARGQHGRRRLDQRVVDARVEETLQEGVSRVWVCSLACLARVYGLKAVAHLERLERHLHDLLLLAQKVTEHRAGDDRQELAARVRVDPVARDSVRQRQRDTNEGCW